MLCMRFKVLDLFGLEEVGFWDFLLGFGYEGFGLCEVFGVVFEMDGFVLEFGIFGYGELGMVEDGMGFDCEISLFFEV